MDDWIIAKYAKELAETLMKMLLFEKDVSLEVRIFRWLFLTGVGVLPWLFGVSLLMR